MFDVEPQKDLQSQQEKITIDELANFCKVATEDELNLWVVEI